VLGEKAAGREGKPGRGGPISTRSSVVRRKKAWPGKKGANGNKGRQRGGEREAVAPCLVKATGGRKKNLVVELGEKR